MLTVEGIGCKLKLNDYGLHRQSKSKLGGKLLRNVHINVTQNAVIKQKTVI